jgi:dTDP-glucose pyrophosphorylase
LSSFYKKVQESTIVFANQAKPLGFANAVYQSRFFCANDDFLVHAGDDLILSDGKPIRRLVSVFSEYKADAVFFAQRVSDPRKYGVVSGERTARGIYQVKQLVEKPSRPESNLAVVAVYVFRPQIYQAIEMVKPGLHNEIQLTDAIQALINQGGSVYAVELRASERRVEIGDPSSYRETFTRVAR